jgi:hypothetical protein
MARKPKKTLDEKCLEMKARQQDINPVMVAFQFKKGVAQLMRKKGVKQKAQEFLETAMDIVVPDEWLVNGLENLRGRKMTFQQILLFRVMYNAVTGTKNNGFKDAQELLNRLLGKVPLVIRHGEAPDDDEEFMELTDDELNAEIVKLAESVRIKRLPTVKAEVVEERK